MEAIACNQCDASNTPGSQQCWLCRGPLGLDREDSASLSRTAQGAGATQRTFGLSSVMLVIALIAVLLGVMREAPGLGILLVIVATPAVIRTWVATSRREAKGRLMTGPEKLWAFAGSIGVILATGIAASAAFSAICFGTLFLGMAGSGPGYGGLVIAAYIGIPLGLLVAGYVFYRFVRWLWPVKE